MKANVGGMEKPARIVIGLLVLSLIFFLEGNARWWGLIGLVPLITGLVGYCPVSALVGINTAKGK
jgi:hypothetical protein